MSIKTLSYIWQTATVGGSKLLVLLAMADFADDNGGSIFPSMATLAAKARLSVDQTRRVVHELIEDGVIELVSQGGWQGARNRSNEYRIVLGGTCNLQVPGADARGGTSTDASTVPAPMQDDPPSDPPVKERVRARTQAEAADQKAARILRRDYSGVEPRLLTTLTNHVKRISGYVYLVDHPGDEGLEDQLRDDAYRLYNLGFNSDEMMHDLEQAWKSYSANFANKMPGKDQLYKIGVMVASGTFNQSNNGTGAGLTLVPWEDAQHGS